MSAAHGKRLAGIIPVCAWCKKIRDDVGTWLAPETYLRERTDAEIAHGLCPDCLGRA